MSRASSDVPTTSPATPASYGISVGAGEQPAWRFGPRIVMLLLTERCLLTSRTGTVEAGVVLGYWVDQRSSSSKPDQRHFRSLAALGGHDGDRVRRRTRGYRNGHAAPPLTARCRDRSRSSTGHALAEPGPERRPCRTPGAGMRCRRRRRRRMLRQPIQSYAISIRYDFSVKGASKNLGMHQGSGRALWNLAPRRSTHDRLSVITRFDVPLVTYRDGPQRALAKWKRRQVTMTGGVFG